MATLKCIQTSYCKSLVEFLIIHVTFTPYTGFIYPTKHVPGFVYKKNATPLNLNYKSVHGVHLSL